MENDIDYTGNDDTMPGGKLKCSSTIQPRCTQRAPVDDVPSCKSFCSLSKYFTWKENRECFCKNSDLVKRQQGGSVSGRTNCQDDNDPELIRDLEGGQVRGINAGSGHRAWLGIPYAKPPLGELRGPIQQDLKLSGKSLLKYSGQNSGIFLVMAIQRFKVFLHLSFSI